MKGRASRAVYMRLQPSLLSPPSDPEEREKKKGSKKKKKGSKKKLHPLPPVRRLSFSSKVPADAGDALRLPV